MTYQKVAGTLSQGAHPGSYNGQDAYNDMLITEERHGRVHNVNRADERRNNEGGCPTLVAGHEQPIYTNDAEYIVRRLTPTECARLQGFPDDWCADVPHSDSAEYKLWGNGIALPCLLPMMKAMADILKEET